MWQGWRRKEGERGKGGGSSNIFVCKWGAMDFLRQERVIMSIFYPRNQSVPSLKTTISLVLKDHIIFQAPHA